jgi:arginine N-succinyltransferase
MSDFTIRPAQSADLPTITEWLGRRATLPVAAADQLWVAQTVGTEATLRATLRLLPALGMRLPRVSYHVGCTVHAASELGLFQVQRTLLLGHDHTGASELAEIAWAQHELPLADQSRALRALVATALHHIHQHRADYAARLVVELPGLRDAAGQSPFWQGLGRHFYRGDPAAASSAHGPDWRSHVAALLPRHALYTSFLPPTAEAAIAQVHPSARVLLEVLEDAGLRYSHHVNVEDGGPILEAAVDDLALLRRAPQT